MKTIVVYLLYVSIILNEARDNSAETCTVTDDNSFNYNNCVRVLASENGCFLSKDQQSWLKTLYDTALQDRTTKTRREIRLMSYVERQKFYSAVNALKQDTSVLPNKFDVLALIHTNNTLCSAHRGANFLGWHRIYLLMFETALRQKDKTMALPYWNSALDYNNTNSIVFTEEFLGNGNGVVTEGPFRNWNDFRGCPLTRNITGHQYALISPEFVRMIELSTSTNLTEQVVDGGPSPRLSTIEGQHNLVHDWVGGDMESLNISANDPAFMLHHAFVDYIWEKFRQKQRILGIDPETDYPSIGWRYLQPFHEANRAMDCFTWMTNIQGYWNNLTHLFEYEDSPECPSCGDSEYLTCNTALNRCVGVTRPHPRGFSMKIWIIVVAVLAVLVLVSSSLACLFGCKLRNTSQKGEKERLLPNHGHSNHQDKGFGVPLLKDDFAKT